MNIFLSTRRPGMQPVKAWAGVAALALGIAFASPAFAAAPPANAVIGNQASASYKDPLGATQSATSNQVITTVQQVGSFNLDTHTTVTTTVVNSKTGAAGAVVYAPHTLTNTGNGTDSFTVSVAAPAAPNGFSKVEVFADANGDGVPDSTTALCSATPGAACSVPAQSVAGSNGTFKFVVAYSIPGTATTGTFTSPVKGTVTAAVVGTVGNTLFDSYPSKTAADVDDVNLTTAAAFNATKGLSVPAVAWSANGGTWPVASATGPRSSSASCAATVAGATSPAAGCVYTTYTLNFSNTGAAPGKFVITDTLPAGFTYVAGSAVWSNAPGTALFDAAAGNPPGIAFQATGNEVTAVVDSLAPNASQTLSFVVLVNNTAVIGTSTTTNTAKYNPLAAPAATVTTPGPTPSSTNPSAYTVTGSYSIVLGSGDTSATAVNAKDELAPPDTPNASVFDTQTVASAAVGSTVKFPGTVFNTGNATDTVNLAVTLGSFPVGTTFSFFAADGLTPLGDSNSDSIPDTGPIAVGANFKYVVAANLPSPGVIPAGPFTTIVKGTSINTGNPTETTRITLTALIGVLVDLTNTTLGNGVPGATANGDVGVGPSPSPTTTLSTPAGTGVLFDLFVQNNDSVSVTYSLAASQTSTFPGSLPAGWTVKFVDAAGTCASTAITNVVVGANAQGNVKACVTPPLSQIPVTAQPIYFQVRSTTPTSTGAIALDTKTDAVTVRAPNTFSTTFTPNNSGQVAPGGSVVYGHTLTNTGGQSCAGSYTLSVAGVGAGWTTALYEDINGNGQIDAAAMLVTTDIPGPLDVGTSKKFLLKVFAPGGAAAGSIDTATVTVTFNAAVGNCGTHSVTDTSTVVTGQMRVQKFQALDTSCAGTITPTASAPLVAKPGECIIYRIEATNQGAAPVTNLSINDALPAYTSLAATQPTPQCTSTGITGSAVAYASTGSAVSCGSAANTVAPGGQAVLTFSVKVDN